jgi:alpha-1,2-mannosyltransferase
VLSHPTWPPLDPVSPAVAEQQLSQSGRVAEVVVVVVLGLVALAVVATLRLPPARLWVALVAVQSAVLLATPVFFDGYASFVAPAGVLLVGAGAHLVWTSGLLRRKPVLRPLTTSAAALVLLAIGWGAVMTDRGGPVRPGPAQQVAAARCVASDSPALLVLVDRLRTNLRNGCPPVFDFSGVAYTLDVPRDRPISPTTLRAESEQYQQFVQDYFAQAEYVILRRRTATGISEATMALLEQRPLVRSSPRVFGPPGAPSVPDQVPEGELQPHEEGDAHAGA